MSITVAFLQVSASADETVDLSIKLTPPPLSIGPSPFSTPSRFPLPSCLGWALFPPPYALDPFRPCFKPPSLILPFLLYEKDIFVLKNW